MKKIVIYQENSDRVILLDDDSTNLETYTKELSKLLESSKVCIIETTSGNFLVKPSKIISLFVYELPLNSENKKEEIVKIEPDIIKD